MSFDERIVALSQRLPKIRDHLQTEESTKNALVMPFISALGYDVFNPQEVVPEFVADVGTKKGEKVDYAILQDGEVILLIECKKADDDLGKTQMSQLYRYFTVTKARIAILTNGIQYWFYSDLEEPNKMDTRPFLELNLDDLRPGLMREVKRLAKDEFDLDQMLSTANELKYTSEIQKALAELLENPDEEFLRVIFAKVNPGSRFIASSKELFARLVPRAFGQFISDKVSNRLRNALQSERSSAEREHQEPEEDGVEDTAERPDGVETTEEELEGFRIVRAIACQAVDINRIAHRDTKSYMGILLDDNNRKAICRLWFNGKQKYLGVFDEGKNESRIPLESASDIYYCTNQILATIRHYEEQG